MKLKETKWETKGNQDRTPLSEELKLPPDLLTNGDRICRGAEAAVAVAVAVAESANGDQLP